MQRTLMLAAAACAAFSSAVCAMNLDPGGTGQVLVFPYYSANGGNDTVLSLSNTTAAGKAVKIRFREGYDGRGVLDLDVYLPPNGQWTASVTSQGDAASAAKLVTNSSACTVPALVADGAAASVIFSDDSYAGDDTQTGPTGNADGGPSTLDRTREGHFDVFEMGEVTGDSLTAITPVDGAPPDCARIAAAWASGGYWTSNPDTDLSPPTGGLYGTAYAVNVTQGTMYAFDADAIDAFSSTIQHTAPGSAAPDLDTASASADGLFAAEIIVGGAALQLEYPNAVDAVSALFMTDVVRGDFTRDASLGSMTDWIVTSPTKRYYVDPAHVSSAAAPFDETFLQHYGWGEETVGGTVVAEWASSFPYACANVGLAGYGRDGTFYPVGQFNPGGPVNGGPSPASNASLTPCLETSVLTFSTLPDAQNFPMPVSALGSSLTNAIDPSANTSHDYTDGVDMQLPSSGSLSIDLTRDGTGNVLTTRALAPAANGDVLLGLPVIAFSATSFINANAAPGMLANYSGVARVHAHVACINGAGPCR